MKKVITVLKPFMTMTKLLEEETATVSLVIPVVKKLHKELTSLDARGIGTLRDEAITQLEKYFAQGTYKEFVDVESSPIHSHATILDPRFKTQGFRSKVKAQIAKSTLISDIHDETRTPEADNQDSGQTEQLAVSTEQTEDSWGDILFEPASTDESGSEAADEGELIKGQIDAYLKEPLLARGKDPLKWWASHQKEYPLLVDHARKYLCIPGSSAASERVFKQTKRIDEPRPRILPKNMEMLLFIKYNLRAIGYETELPQPPSDWSPPNKNKIPISENIAQEPETSDSLSEGHNSEDSNSESDE